MQSHLEQCRHNMVEQQVRPWDVLDSKVLNTLDQIPRDQYVPRQYVNLAYADTAIPLNDNACMMHPVMEGRLLQSLDIQPDEKILEVGTGSGYLTACLAHLGGHVDSIEIDEALANQATQTLQQQGISNASVSSGSGLDISATNRYDVIALTGSTTEVPENLKLALRKNGRMFVISGHSPVMIARLVTRTGDNDWSIIDLFDTDLPALAHGETAEEFKF